MRNLLPLGGLVLVFCLAFFGEQGLMANHELRQEMTALQDEIDGLRTENARLSEQVQAMHDDPITVDRTIREEMFMVSADRKETVFVFPEGESSGASEITDPDPAAASGMR
jgi:cell division protein FtsB